MISSPENKVFLYVPTIILCYAAFLTVLPHAYIYTENVQIYPRDERNSNKNNSLKVRNKYTEYRKLFLNFSFTIVSGIISNPVKPKKRNILKHTL